MVLLHLFDESQTRLADFGHIPECKSKNPTGSLPLAKMLHSFDAEAKYRPQAKKRMPLLVYGHVKKLF